MVQKLGMSDNRTKIKEAIILAGGLGIRIRTLFPDIPKCMVPVAGRPFLDHLLLKLKSQGFTKIILSVGYKKKYIQSYYGKKFEDLSIFYSEEDEILGTGGAIKKAFQLCDRKFCFVFNGDSYLNFSIQDFIDEIDQEKLNILTVMVDDICRFGALNIDNNLNKFSFIKGQSGSGFINSGVYCINYEIFKNINDKTFSFEDQILRDCDLINSNIIFTKYSFIDIGIPSDYENAKKFLTNLG